MDGAYNDELVLILKLYATEISDYFDLFHSFPDYF